MANPNPLILTILPVNPSPNVLSARHPPDMANRSRSGGIPQVQGAHDSALGSTRQSESVRTDRDATPSLAFSARGPGRHRDAEETCGKLGSAVRAR